MRSLWLSVDENERSLKLRNDRNRLLPFTQRDTFKHLPSNNNHNEWRDKEEKKGRKRVKIIAAFIIVHSPTWEENVQRRWKFRRDGAWIVLFGSREIRAAEMIFHPFQFNWKVTHTKKQNKTQKSITPVIFFNKWITKQSPFLDNEMGIKYKKKKEVEPLMTLFSFPLQPIRHLYYIFKNKKKKKKVTL